MRVGSPRFIGGRMSQEKLQEQCLVIERAPTLPFAVRSWLTFLTVSNITAPFGGLAAIIDLLQKFK